MSNFRIKFISFLKSLLAAQLSILLLIAIPDYEAFCETRTSDIIVSDSLSARGLKSAQCPNVFCSNAVLKTKEGKVLFSRDADTEVKIASLTKIMTAIVALDNYSIDGIIAVTARAVSTGGSSAGLRVGDTLTLTESLYALMIPSGNDAACAIAQSVGKQISHSTDDNVAYDAFISKMNEKANQLGCTHTKFTNPHGLDDGDFSSDSHSSANDLMLIIEYAMQNTTFSEVVKNYKHELTYTRDGSPATKTLETTDSLLGNFDGACGIKTGTTDLAGYCFAGACEREGEMLYCVVLGSTDDSTRFEDTKNLFSWYFDNLVDYKLLNASDNIVACVSNTSWIDKNIPATFSERDATCRIFKYDGNVSQKFNIDSISGDVSAGDRLGKVDFYQNNTIIASVDLVAISDCKGPNFFESIQIAFLRFVNIFTGGQNESNTLILNDTPLVLEFS